MDMDTTGPDYCLSNLLHGIGQTIKSLDVRAGVRDLLTQSSAV